MSYRIHIPKPCHEDWNAMTPNEQGRHCALCSNTVVDFTNWSVEDIATYLKQQNNVCGRLASAQLGPQKEDVLQNIIASSLSYWKKIAAIVLICFSLAGTSFAQSKQQQPNTTSLQKPQKTERPIMGMVAQVPPQHCADTVTTGDSMQVKHPQVMGKIKMTTPPAPPEQIRTGEVIITDTSRKK
jgi:hypothetical protein